MIHRVVSPRRRFAYPQGYCVYNRTVLKPFHIDIMHLAFDGVLRSYALEKMIEANVKQDRLPGLIGHDEYHFDNNAFEKSYAYIEEQRTLTVSALTTNDAPSAWSAFGRLTHTVQDFYAHSNYIELWLSAQPRDAIPAPPDVVPLDLNLINSPALRSGRVYFLEALTFIHPLKPLIMSHLPRDSHAWMNLDSPERGPNFKYAFQAALKRTVVEFERTIKKLPEDLLGFLLDK